MFSSRVQSVQDAWQRIFYILAGLFPLQQLHSLSSDCRGFEGVSFLRVSWHVCWSVFHFCFSVFPRLVEKKPLSLSFLLGRLCKHILVLKNIPVSFTVHTYPCHVTLCVCHVTYKCVSIAVSCNTPLCKTSKYHPCEDKNLFVMYEFSAVFSICIFFSICAISRPTATHLLIPFLWLPFLTLRLPGSVSFSYEEGKVSDFPPLDNHLRLIINITAL